MRKRLSITLMLLAVMLLTIIMMGAQCTRTPDAWSYTEGNDAAAIRDAAESAFHYSAGMTETEKQELYEWLAEMPADEFNEAIDQEMESLSDSETQELLDWLKNNYLVYNGCSSDNWRLPTQFNKPGELGWPDGIPEPAQGTISQIEQSEKVTRVQIQNITKATYQSWKSKFDAQWSATSGMQEAVDEHLSKAKEYVELNTKYHLGDDAKTTGEQYLEAGRTQAESIIFTDESMGIWLELTYGQNMATVAWRGDFNSGGASTTEEKTDEQKIMEAGIVQFAIVDFPASKAGTMVKYTPEGKTKEGHRGQVLLFEGGTSQTAEEWQQRFVSEGWDIKIYQDAGENYFETEMYDIDGTKDLYPDIDGFTHTEHNVYFERVTGDKVQRILMTTVETSYGTAYEVDRESPDYQQWTIITINERDL